MSPSGLDRLIIGAALALVAPAAARAQDWVGNRINLGATEARMPVTSMQERKFQTVVRQQYDYSCGSAALATLLRHHYGLPVDERVTFLGMWAEGDQATIRKLGFSLLDMKRYLAGRGLNADGYKVTLAQVAAVRTPGIVLLDIEGYKHFVVVKGVDARTVLLGDPSLGLRRMSVREFQHAWNGIYFAINQAGTAAPFNARIDLALAPSVSAEAGLRPLSEAAVALLRPQPGEF